MEKRNSHSIKVRVVSTLLVVSFFVSQIGYAEPMTGLAGDKPLQILLSEPSNFQIPSSFVTLQEVYRGTNNTLIIHIQDAHTNLSGQENLASALDELMSRYGISLVFSEGGVKDCSLTPLKKIAPKSTWKRIAKTYLVEGKINGEEYLNLISDHPIKIMGIEDLKLYSQSLQDYAGLAGKRQKALDYLKQIQGAVNKVKTRLYPKELLDFERQKENAPADLQFKTVLELAQSKEIDFSNFPNLHKLIELQLKEKLMNFELISMEHVRLLEDLKQKGIAVNASPKGGNASERTAHSFSYFRNTLNSAIENSLDTHNYPMLLEYADYLDQFSQMDMDKLLEELEAVENKIYDSFFSTDDSRLIRSIDRFITLLFKAYQIQMSTQDFAMFSLNERDFATVSYLAFINRKLAEFGYFEDMVVYTDILEQGQDSLEAFYNSVTQRDFAFMKNIEENLGENKAAFLIAGGYHTPHLKKLMREKGYSYIVLTPVITSETNQQKYEKRLLAPMGQKAKKVETGGRRYGNSDYLRPALLGVGLGGSEKIESDATARKVIEESRAEARRLIEALSDIKGTDIQEARRFQDALGARLAGEKTSSAGVIEGTLEIKKETAGEDRRKDEYRRNVVEKIGNTINQFLGFDEQAMRLVKDLENKEGISKEGLEGLKSLKKRLLDHDSLTVLHQKTEPQDRIVTFNQMGLKDLNTILGPSQNDEVIAERQRVILDLFKKHKLIPSGYDARLLLFYKGEKFVIKKEILDGLGLEEVMKRLNLVSRELSDEMKKYLKKYESDFIREGKKIDFGTYFGLSLPVMKEADQSFDDQKLSADFQALLAAKFARRLGESGQPDQRGAAFDFDMFRQLIIEAGKLRQGLGLSMDLREDGSVEMPDEALMLKVRKKREAELEDDVKKGLPGAEKNLILKRYLDMIDLFDYPKPWNHKDGKGVYQKRDEILKILEIIENLIQDRAPPVDQKKLQELTSFVKEGISIVKTNLKNPGVTKGDVFHAAVASKPSGSIISADIMGFYVFVVSQAAKAHVKYLKAFGNLETLDLKDTANQSQLLDKAIELALEADDRIKDMVGEKANKLNIALEELGLPIPKIPLENDSSADMVYLEGGDEVVAYTQRVVNESQLERLSRKLEGSGGLFMRVSITQLIKSGDYKKYATDITKIIHGRYGDTFISSLDGDNTLKGAIAMKDFKTGVISEIFREGNQELYVYYPDGTRDLVNDEFREQMKSFSAVESMEPIEQDPISAEDIVDESPAPQEAEGARLAPALAAPPKQVGRAKRAFEGDETSSLLKNFDKDSIQMVRLSNMSLVIKGLNKDDGQTYFIKINLPNIQNANGQPIGEQVTQREIAMMDELRVNPDFSVTGRLLPDYGTGKLGLADIGFIDGLLKKTDAVAKSKADFGWSFDSKRPNPFGFKVGWDYLVTKQAAGVSVENYLKSVKERLSASNASPKVIRATSIDTLKVLKNVLQVILQMNEKGLAHRDLSDAEIFVDPVTGQVTALIDWGIAAKFDSKDPTGLSEIVLKEGMSLKELGLEPFGKANVFFSSKVPITVRAGSSMHSHRDGISALYLMNLFAGVFSAYPGISEAVSKIKFDSFDDRFLDAWAEKTSSQFLASLMGEVDAIIAPLEARHDLEQERTFVLPVGKRLLLRNKQGEPVFLKDKQGRPVLTLNFHGFRQDIPLAHVEVHDSDRGTATLLIRRPIPGAGLLAVEGVSPVEAIAIKKAQTPMTVRRLGAESQGLQKSVKESAILLKGIEYLSISQKSHAQRSDEEDGLILTRLEKHIAYLEKLSEETQVYRKSPDSLMAQNAILIHERLTRAKAVVDKFKLDVYKSNQPKVLTAVSHFFETQIVPLKNIKGAKELLGYTPRKLEQIKEVLKEARVRYQALSVYLSQAKEVSDDPNRALARQAGEILSLMNQSRRAINNVEQMMLGARLTESPVILESIFFEAQTAAADSQKILTPFLSEYTLSGEIKTLMSHSESFVDTDGLHAIAEFIKNDRGGKNIVIRHWLGGGGYKGVVLVGWTDSQGRSVEKAYKYFKPGKLTQRQVHYGDQSNDQEFASQINRRLPLAMETVVGSIPISGGIVVEEQALATSLTGSLYTSLDYGNSQLSKLLVEKFILLLDGLLKNKIWVMDPNPGNFLIAQDVRNENQSRLYLSDFDAAAIMSEKEGVYYFGDSQNTFESLPDQHLYFLQHLLELALRPDSADVLRSTAKELANRERAPLLAVFLDRLLSHPNFDVYFNFLMFEWRKTWEDPAAKFQAEQMLDQWVPHQWVKEEILKMIASGGGHSEVENTLDLSVYPYSADEFYFDKNFPSAEISIEEKELVVKLLDGTQFVGDTSEKSNSLSIDLSDKRAYTVIQREDQSILIHFMLRPLITQDVSKNFASSWRMSVGGLSPEDMEKVRDIISSGARLSETAVTGTSDSLRLSPVLRLPSISGNLVSVDELLKQDPSSGNLMTGMFDKKVSFSATPFMFSNQAFFISSSKGSGIVIAPVYGGGSGVAFRPSFTDLKNYKAQEPVLLAARSETIDRMVEEASAQTLRHLRVVSGQPHRLVVLNVVAEDLFTVDAPAVVQMVRNAGGVLKNKGVFLQFIKKDGTLDERYTAISDDLPMGQEYGRMLLASEDTVRQMEVSSDSGLMLIDKKADKIIPILGAFMTAAAVKQAGKTDKIVQHLKDLSQNPLADFTEKSVGYLQQVPEDFKENKENYLKTVYRPLMVQVLRLSFEQIIAYGTRLAKAVQTMA